MKEILLQRLKEKLKTVKEQGIARLKNGLKNQSRSIQREVREKVVGYILAGLGVVAGLAWNDAISALINHLFPFGKGEVWAKFFYAFVLTIFVVLTTTYLMKILWKDDSDKG